MDTSEFTEAFDLGRFKAGEYALTRFNQLVKYHSIVDDRFYVTRPGENCPGWCLVEDLPAWRMKPAEKSKYHTPVYVGIDWSKDVAAYLRFCSSPRGKEALAQIGRADGPQFKPLGEDAMLNIFSAALTEFEAEIERRRK